MKETIIRLAKDYKEETEAIEEAIELLDKQELEGKLSHGTIEDEL